MRLKPVLQQDYEIRINKVFEFIDQNLNEELSLEIVAGIAYFSPFHFHRVFKYITGETLNGYINRRKIEKATSILIHKKELGINELGTRYGFNSNSSFTRTFRKFYGISPTLFREQHKQKYSKISQLKSKNGQDDLSFEKYFCVIENLKIWLNMNTKIEIKELPQTQLAYVSCIGPQNLETAFNRLIKWAKPKGLLEQKDLMLLTVYHDSFKITASEKVRMNASIVLQNETDTNGEVSLGSIEKGRFLTGRFFISQNEFEKAWTSLFIWMNEHGYQKADRNPFEIYYNDFREHPEKKFDVELFVPVK